MKYFYIAAQQRTETGFYAANVCSSKKQAIEIAEAWNAQFIANGTHAFLRNTSDDPEVEEFIDLPF